MQRRNYILGLSVLLAGCSTPGQSSDGLTLGDIDVMNLHEKPHDVWIEVLRDGESVVNKEFSLGTGEGTRGALIEATWNDSPAIFEIDARLDGGEVQSVKLTEDNVANGCTVGYVAVSRRSGRLNMWTSRAVNTLDCSGT